jgi:hypothetical protein
MIIMLADYSLMDKISSKCLQSINIHFAKAFALRCFQTSEYGNQYLPLFILNQQKEMEYEYLAGYR